MGANAMNGRSPNSAGRGGGPANLSQYKLMHERDRAARQPRLSRNDSSIGKSGPDLPPPTPAGRPVGLPGQRAFQEELQRCIEHSTHLGRRFALLLFDLDRFERIRCDVGPAGVDQLLARVAHRLRGQIRSVDMAALLDVDAFAVLLVETATHGEAAHRARQMVAAVGRPIEVEGHYVMLTASVGVALFGADGCTADDLTRAAAVALARAKRSGGRQVVVNAGE